jgi:hypothetical protein
MPTEKSASEINAFFYRIERDLIKHLSLKELSQETFNKIVQFERPIDPDAFSMIDLYRRISFKEFKCMVRIVEEAQYFLLPDTIPFDDSKSELHKTVQKDRQTG